MKKYFLGVLTGFIVCTMLVSTMAIANSPIRLIVNGNEVVSDVPPQIIDGRTMVPARPLAEALGADVRWDAESNAVVVTGGVQAGAVPTDLEPVREDVNEPVNEPTREPVGNTAEPTGGDGMLKINGEAALSQKWLEKDGDVLVSLSVIGEIFTEVLGARDIEFLFNGNDVQAQVNGEKYPIEQKFDESGANFSSVNSLIATGLFDYTWDSENANLIIAKK